MNLGDLGELALVERLGRYLAEEGGPLLLGPGHDAAIVLPLEGNLVFKVDALVEGRHFDLAFSTPQQVGWRALARPASDIAAVSGAPDYALVTLFAPASCPVEVVDGLYEGLAEAAKAFGTKLVGGETTSAEELALSVAILGSVEPGESKGRSGARAGDKIWISGFLGDAAAGLAILKAGGVTELAAKFLLSSEESAALATCVEHHQTPCPRLALGKALGANPEITAMMDVSDGLVIDLHRLAKASGLVVRLQLEALPLSPGALLAARLLGLDPLALALGGGDDYELLVCSTQDLLDCDILKKLLPIGRLEETDGPGGNVLRETGEVLPLTGWDHFA